MTERVRDTEHKMTEGERERVCDKERECKCER